MSEEVEPIRCAHGHLMFREACPSCDSHLRNAHLPVLVTARNLLGRSVTVCSACQGTERSMAHKAATGAVKAPRRAKNTSKQGAAFEGQIMEDLWRHGYDVTRSAASKGTADVIAIGDGQVLFVQAKISSPLIPPSERRAVVDLADRLPDIGVPLVAFRVAGKVWYRELLGTAPKEYQAWAPTVHGTAVCTCGHLSGEHTVGDEGTPRDCWHLEVVACACPSFTLDTERKRSRG